MQHYCKFAEKILIYFRPSLSVFLSVRLSVCVCVCVCVCVGGGGVCVCVRLPCLYFRGLSYENTPIHRGLYTFRGPKNGSSENVG